MGDEQPKRCRADGDSPGELRGPGDRSNVLEYRNGPVLEVQEVCWKWSGLEPWRLGVVMMSKPDESHRATELKPETMLRSPVDRI